MTIGGEDIWNWLRKAPLPVVLAISLSSTLLLSGWIWAVEGKAADAATAAQVAQESKRDQSRRIEKIDEKLDKLLEAVVELKAVSKEEKKPAVPPAKKETK
jgi:hypothetical protein